jgi:hypothetical protein
MQISDEFVESARRRCLWYFAADDLPAERSHQLETLELIERYGNRDDYVRARSRKQRESYVAGGVALNTLLRAPRRSQDIDLVHDSREAVGR